jgi:phenylpropionate dioxygenase-like ring-hydroxylating dioxygenase large terminal subunit
VGWTTTRWPRSTACERGGDRARFRAACCRKEIALLKQEDNELLTETGPGTPMGEFFRAFWVPCLTSSEIPEPDCPPVRVFVLGEELLAFRDTEGRVGLVDAYCVHRRAPLFYGRNEECGLRCVYHGWKFDVTGQCVDMPNEPGESRFKEKVELRAYPTREAGGIVWAYMGPDEQPPAMPNLEWLDLPGSHWLVDKSLVECNYLQAAEGDHDSSHASWLHATLDNQLEDSYRMADTQFTQIHMMDKAPRLYVLETDFGFVTGSRRRGMGENNFWRLTTWLMPFYSMIAAEPGTTLVMNVRVPVDDEASWLFRVAYHPTEPLTERERASYTGLGSIFQEKIPGSFRAKANFDNDYLVDRLRQKHETFSGIKSLPAQDRAVTERMAARPGGSRAIVDRTTERLASSDASIIQLRKQLTRLARDYQNEVAPPTIDNPDLYFVRAPAIQLPPEVPFDVGAADYLQGKSWERQDPSMFSSPGAAPEEAAP